MAEMRTRLSRTFVVRGDSPALLARLLDGLDEEALWIGFARRFAPYKRATLLFQDPARLAKLLSDPAKPVRVVFAGKAHPNDGIGKELVKRIFELTREERFQGKVFFLEDYDVALARALVQGADVWLNTPVRWLEASGTSGMKAAANGTLNLSIGDGWWPEAFDGENGWQLGGSEYKDQALLDQFDASHLYGTPAEEVIPLYFERDPRASRRAGSSASSAASPRCRCASTRTGWCASTTTRRTRTSASPSTSSCATSAGSSRCSCRRTSGSGRDSGRSRSCPRTSASSRACTSAIRSRCAWR
jgi:starch phosphorylase